MMMLRLGLLGLLLCLWAAPVGAQISPGTVNVRNLLNTQGSTTSGQSGVLSLGAVTTSAPSYTNAQSSPISLDTAGNLRVNCISGCSAAGDSSTGSTALGALNDVIAVALAGTRGATFQLLAGGTGVYTATPKCNFAGTAARVSTDTTGYLVDVVSGALSTSTVIASGQALTNFQVMCAQGASHAKMEVTAYTGGTANWIGRSTVATWPGVAWANVNTSAPSYTNAQISPLSMTTSGALRVDASGTTVPTSVGAITLTGSAQQAVTASAVALGSNTSKSVCVKVLLAGTQTVYFGVSGVTTGTGMELSPGDGWCGNIANTNQVFVIAGSTGSTVSYEWLN